MHPFGTRQTFIAVRRVAATMAIGIRLQVMLLPRRCGCIAAHVAESRLNGLGREHENQYGRQQFHALILRY